MPPNSANNFFGIKVSKAGIPVNQATDKQLIYKDDFSTKTYFDTTNSRMIEGLLPDGTYGLWVSKPGFNVTTATDDQLVFNSNQNIFKIVKSGTYTIPEFNLAAGSLVIDAVAIPHGLSYIPILQAYGQVTQFLNFSYPVISVVTVLVYTALPYTPTFLDPNIQIYRIDIGVDATNVYISWVYDTTSGGSGGIGYDFPAVPIKYDLLQESAN